MKKPRTCLFVASFCLLLLSACSSHPRKVDCEAHLTPINAPAPVSKEKEEHP